MPLHFILFVAARPIENAQSSVAGWATSFNLCLRVVSYYFSVNTARSGELFSNVAQATLRVESIHTTPSPFDKNDVVERNYS